MLVLIGTGYIGNWFSVSSGFLFEGSFEMDDDPREPPTTVPPDKLSFISSTETSGKRWLSNERSSMTKEFKYEADFVGDVLPLTTKNAETTAPQLAGRSIVINADNSSVYNKSVILLHTSRMTMTTRDFLWFMSIRYHTKDNANQFP